MAKKNAGNPVTDDECVNALQTIDRERRGMPATAILAEINRKRAEDESDPAKPKSVSAHLQVMVTNSKPLVAVRTDTKQHLYSLIHIKKGEEPVADEPIIKDPAPPVNPPAENGGNEPPVVLLKPSDALFVKIWALQGRLASDECKTQDDLVQLTIPEATAWCDELVQKVAEKEKRKPLLKPPPVQTLAFSDILYREIWEMQGRLAPAIRKGRDELTRLTIPEAEAWCRLLEQKIADKERAWEVATSEKITVLLEPVVKRIEALEQAFKPLAADCALKVPQAAVSKSFVDEANARSALADRVEAPELVLSKKDPPTATPAEVKNPSVRSRLLIFILLFLGAVGVTISMIRYWPGITGFVRPSTAAVEEAKPENVESVPTSDEDSLQRALEEHDRLFNTKD